MIQRLIPSVLVLLLLATPGFAQEFSGGFKAGLNFSNIDGPAEMSNGREVETFSTTTGFHIGATFALAFTDLVGVKADLMYSQKGTEISYEGPSYLRLYTVNGDASTVFGSQRSQLDITNSYIDIPLMAYFKIGRRIELEGGVSAGFLVSSLGNGGATYSGLDGLNDITVRLEYNFLSDEARTAGIVELAETPFLPAGVLSPEAIGAYYNRDSDENYFSRLDFGLVGGLLIFINEGLYIGGRVNYGLSDVSRTEGDRALSELDGQNQPPFREDTDHNLSLQTSVGFRF
jgi:hypothetical protein